jgi:hypothetical protein
LLELRPISPDVREAVANGDLAVVFEIGRLGGWFLGKARGCENQKDQERGNAARFLAFDPLPPSAAVPLKGGQ